MDYIKYGFRSDTPTSSPERLTTEVGEGWKNIILDLCEDIRKLGWDGRVYQVKEKFGTLCFYIGYGTPAIWDRIAKAELESSKTCEVCGEPGEIRSGGWVKTLCDKHARERY